MKNLLVITALIAGILTPAVLADNENNLVQLDLKRSSNNAVDVTLVTSENYGDNVMVRKKSDNKYVILVPKVQSSGFSASNLNGVKDLVSDVDVKTVNDTTGGYTKVTLITTKPLDIKTRTAKSAPLTSEQKEYNTLISQANAVRNTINTETPKIREQKTEVTVDKAPAQQAKQDSTPKAESVKKEIKKEVKKEIKLTEITPDKAQKPNAKTTQKEIKQQEKALEEIPETVPAPDININEEIVDIQELPAKTPLISILAHKVKNGISKVAHKIPSTLPKAFGWILIALASVSILRLLTNKPNKTDSIIRQYNTKPAVQPKNYDNIVNNEELSWKEKYNLYLDKSAKPVARANKKGNYSFIKTPSQSAIDKKREELEKLVEETTYTAKHFDEPEVVEVQSEDTTISRTIKFKAFDNQTNSLKMTSRNRVPSRFKKYEIETPLKEQNTVNLEDSPLGSNPRSLKGANLKVADVDKKRIKYEPKEYIMSSIDEYLNILDREEKVKPAPAVSTNPIAKSKPDNFLKGTVVKSGVKLSQNKGIYLVNKEGKNTLVGKVNDKVFVLKKFDDNITNPIQVRHDNANVYMVKAGGFKSLVEINDEKMGVLIEL